MPTKKTKNDADKPSADLDAIRHSMAHLLATAVLKKFPKAKLGIGPTIEHGFYYDFDLPRSLSPEDLKELEKEMRRLARANLPFWGKKVSPAEARKLFKDQPYKLDLIKEFSKEGKKLTVYYTGGSSRKPDEAVFMDLCRGGHVKNTKEIDPEAFKLQKIAGAYWRGDEKNPQLQRVYGIAFDSKKELKEHLEMLEEAKKRDHRKIGQEQELFMIHDMIGKGLPIWLPKGNIMKEEVENLAKKMESKYKYERVTTPHLGKKELYLTSGHLPYYEESMYPAMKMDDGTYYLRAMNCPHHHLIYKLRPRSYRELPLRIAEYGTVYRNELSGTLAGLLRVRMLSMNDAHIYCAKDQIETEVRSIIQMTLEYFEIFGLKEYWFRLSRWDSKNKEKYIDEPDNWDYSEGILRKVLRDLKVKFIEAENEAAFYGPKIDVQFRSVIGREETMSTVQLDFAAKSRFKLMYRDSEGKDNNEVFVIHRAPLSTHERFMAFLIEHFAGAFPLWLAPVQVAILPVSEKHLAYAKKVLSLLQENGMRADIPPADETLGKRIRTAEKMKVPYILVVGDEERKKNTVNVREGQSGKKAKNKEMKPEAFVKKLAREVEQKKY